MNQASLLPLIISNSLPFSSSVPTSLPCFAIHDCQIFPFSLTQIFAPHPKYWHQPLALVISVTLLPGATGEVKCCLFHPPFLWLCSTQNSHLLIQVWFDFSYSLSLTTSLFPLTYNLSVVTVIFFISPFSIPSMCKVSLTIRFYHCPTSPHLFMSDLSPYLPYNLILCCAFSTDFSTLLLSLAFMIHFSPHSWLTSDVSRTTFFYSPSNLHFSLLIFYLYFQMTIISNVPLPHIFLWASFS